jgi:hypothetical protein
MTSELAGSSLLQLAAAPVDGDILILPGDKRRKQNKRINVDG